MSSRIDLLDIQRERQFASANPFFQSVAIYDVNVVSPVLNVRLPLLLFLLSFLFSLALRETISIISWSLKVLSEVKMTVEHFIINSYLYLKYFFFLTKIIIDVHIWKFKILIVVEHFFTLVKLCHCDYF